MQAPNKNWKQKFHVSFLEVEARCKLFIFVRYCRKIRLIEGNAKYHHLKKLTCKGTLRQVFIRVYRLEIQSVMLVFSTQLQLSPTLPVKKIMLYTTVCKGGGVWGSGPQTDKHLPQSPFTGQLFQMTIFCIVFYESYLTKTTSLRLPST